MERSGGGSGVPRLRTFRDGQARVGAEKLRPKHLAIFVQGLRSAVGNGGAGSFSDSVLRPIATKLVRRDECVAMN